MTYLIALLGIVSVFSAGFFYGQHIESNENLVHLAHIQAEQQQRYNDRTNEMNALAEALEKAKKERQIEVHAITHQVDKIIDTRPAYRNDCFDDDGLRIANTALTRQPVGPRKPDAIVPRSGAAR